MKNSYKDWVKKINNDFESIQNQSDFKAWTEEQNLSKYEIGQLDYRTTLQSIKPKNSSCVWEIFLDVRFGISRKEARPRQYTNKIIQHDVRTKPCHRESYLLD